MQKLQNSLHPRPTQRSIRRISNVIGPSFPVCCPVPYDASVADKKDSSPWRLPPHARFNSSQNLHANPPGPSQTTRPNNLTRGVSLTLRNWSRNTLHHPLKTRAPILHPPHSTSPVGPAIQHTTPLSRSTHHARKSLIRSPIPKCLH